MGWLSVKIKLQLVTSQVQNPVWLSQKPKNDVIPHSVPIEYKSNPAKGCRVIFGDKITINSSMGFPFTSPGGRLC